MFRKCLSCVVWLIDRPALCRGNCTCAGIQNPTAAVAWTIILALLFGLYGWRLVRTLGSQRNVVLLIGIPLMPLVIFATLIGFGALLLPIAVAYPFWRVKHAVRKRQYQNTLKHQGRFITIDVLQSRLNAGEGTLIEDTGQKGPYRIWWTEDDLFGLGNPVSTKDEFLSALGGEHAFNTQCLNEYLDEKAGRALLTSMPARYAKKGGLAQMFPRMKVVAVIRPLSRPKAPDHNSLDRNGD